MYPGGIETLESTPGLLKTLKIRAQDINVLLLLLYYICFPVLGFVTRNVFYPHLNERTHFVFFSNKAVLDFIGFVVNFYGDCVPLFYLFVSHKQQNGTFIYRQRPNS